MKHRGGLSRALASPRILVHDRGRVLADLACAIADGARVMSDQRELFRLVASVPKDVDHIIIKIDAFENGSWKTKGTAVEYRPADCVDAPPI